MIERGARAGLNHLLAQQPWAADRLRAFAGRCVEFRCPPLPDLRLKILADGFLGTAGDAPENSLVVTLKPGALPLLLAGDESALKQVQIEGAADLADAARDLMRRLAWDIEEDLSRLVGDVAAHRIAGAGRAFAGWQREAALRIAQNLAEYWTEEKPLLSRPEDAAEFRREVEALIEDAAGLEQRIERLEGRARR